MSERLKVTEPSSRPRSRIFTAISIATKRRPMSRRKTLRSCSNSTRTSFTSLPSVRAYPSTIRTNSHYSNSRAGLSMSSSRSAACKTRLQQTGLKATCLKCSTSQQPNRILRTYTSQATSYKSFTLPYLMRQTRLLQSTITTQILSKNLSK
jgi:NAD(P)-dependent dehydrogenase (short-subunit alcohol dehydrogenase family)